MGQTVRVDAAIYASVVAALESLAPLVAKTLREAVVESRQYDADSEEPVDVKVVTDLDGDQWIRLEGGWVTEGATLASPWPWSRMVRHFSPVTVVE
jgi:hypothetical protein